LKETLPLVVIGGLAGWWLSENINTWMWTQMPALKGGTVDTPIKITFLMVLVLGVTLIGGLVPSLYVTNLDLNSYLKSAPRNRRLFSTQEFLVGVQLSLTLMLLVGVGMLVRSMLFNVDIPIGWATRDVAVVTLEHPRYSNVVMSGNEARRYAKLNQDIQQELYAMSEVMSVGILSPIPFSAESARSSQSQLVISKTLLPQGQSSLSGSFGAMALSASPNGFSILGIPLVSGRYFTEADVANRNEIVGRSLAERLKYGRDEGAVIINQALAERMWPGENPIDKIFYVMDASYKVVGVIQNYHHVFGNKDFIPTRYIPATDALIKLEFLVKLRPNTSLKNFHLNVRKRLSDFVLDWLEIQPLGERVEDAMANKRLTLQLLSCFAILGIIVSGLAVYSIATLAAVSRIKEMGVRMALGAQTRNIYRLAFCRGIRAILLGLPLGLLLALILCKVLSSFLVYANIYDPLIWTMSCGMLIVITIVAAIIPILRVTHVDPVNVLRNE
jgi:ABC-type antimicrobial peptide transport system permease subunit